MRLGVLLLVFWAVACQGDEPTDQPGPDPFIVLFSAEQSVVDSVIRVTWSTQSPATGWVERFDGVDWQPCAYADTEALEQEILLLGLKPFSEVSLRVVAESAEGSWTSDAMAVTLGGPDADLPESVTERRVEDLGWGFVVLPLIVEGQSYSVIIDGDGDVVWSWQAVDELVMRTRLSWDRQAVLYMDPGVGSNDEDLTAEIVRVSLDGERVERVPVLYGHMDFVELPDGRYATLGWDRRTVEDGRAILADTIVLVDPDGSSEILWNAWDVFEFGPDSDTMIAMLPWQGEEDWTHGNYLSFDGENNRFLAVMDGVNALVSVDAVTGETQWVVREGVADPSEWLLYQAHSVEPTENGVLVFNRRDTNLCSQVAEIDLTNGASAPTLAWRHTSRDCIGITFMGQAQRLDNGNTLVSWSTAGRIDEVTAEHEVVWSQAYDLGAGVGYLQPVPSLYPACAGDERARGCLQD